MPPSLILFDLDETLFDHTYASRCALAALRQSHARLGSVPIARLEAVSSRILEETHRRVLDGAIGLAAARLERQRLLFAAFGLRPGGSELERASLLYREAYLRSRRPVRGARELLGALFGGHLIGIVTNNFREEQESKLRHCGLADRVHFMVTSEETGVPKPERAIFEAALERASTSGADAVMVGDNWSSDVLGARNAGIRAVWFNRRRARPPASDPVSEIHSFLPTGEARNLILGSVVGGSGGIPEAGRDR